jgi:hypothetical protein
MYVHNNKLSNFLTIDPSLHTTASYKLVYFSFTVRMSSELGKFWKVNYDVYKSHRVRLNRFFWVPTEYLFLCLCLGVSFSELYAILFSRFVIHGPDLIILLFCQILEGSICYLYSTTLPWRLVMRYQHILCFLFSLDSSLRRKQGEP